MKFFVEKLEGGGLLGYENACKDVRVLFGVKRLDDSHEISVVEEM